MKKLITTALSLTLAWGANAQTVVTITDADLTNGTYNWTSDKVYHLDGMVYLETGGVLNIQAGTVIQGMAVPSNPNDAASALVITRGARIYANGHAGQPIIFTTDQDDMNSTTDLTKDDRALWGGIIILGNGIVGNGSGAGQIEGIPSNEPRGAYGGSDNNESSGSLKYVSIRHGGAVIGANNEINGLTLGAVGSGTTLEYIEVFANEDDGIEWFGGSANIKYATVAFCGDDSFDWDEAWTGKAQFIFSIQNNDIGDCGFEGDGANPASANPVSNPTIYNATLIGAGVSGATAANSHGMLLRDNTNATIANSIIADFAHKGIQVQDVGGSSADSYAKIGSTPGMNILNNLFWQIGNNTTLDGSSSGIILPTGGADDATASNLAAHLGGNSNMISNPGFPGISRTPNGGLDPRPMNNAGTTNLAALPANDAFFTQVNYKGAFDPFFSYWIVDWTALDQYGFLSQAVSVAEQKSPVSVKLYPNPAGQVLHMALHGMVTGEVVIRIIDLTGREVAEVYNGTVTNPSFTKSIDINQLSKGIYLLQINHINGTASERFVKH